MIRIPQPCFKKWEDLEGTDQTKYCDLCDKNIYNLKHLDYYQIQDLFEREGKLCGMISKEKNDNRSRYSLKNAIILMVFLATNLFGQQDSIQVNGIVRDSNGFPIMNSKISLKNFPIESITDENGRFNLSVPKDLKTYTLIANENGNQIEILYKEEELYQDLILPIENPEDFIIGEVIYTKPTFKRKVINTITWPYRKIRKTFFNN